MKNVLFSLLAALVVACGKVPSHPAIGVLEGGVLATVGKMVYYVANGSYYVTNLQFERAFFDEGQAFVLNRGKLYSLTLEPWGLTTQMLVEGEAVMFDEGKFVVKVGKSLRIFSNTIYQSSLVLGEDFDTYDSWRTRYLVTLNGDCLKVWHNRQDAPQLEVTNFIGIECFTIAIGSPYVYFARNQKEITTFNFYTRQTELFETMPFTLHRMKYLPQWDALLMVGEGAVGLYYLATGEIVLWYVEAWDADIDTQNSNLYVLKTNAITVIDSTTKETLRSYYFSVENP